MAWVLWHAVVGAAVPMEFMIVQCSLSTLQQNARLRKAMLLLRLLTVSVVLDLLSAIAVMYGVIQETFQSEFCRVLSPASSFNLKFPVVSLRSYSNCLRLLPPLAVSSILPSTFPSVTCFRRQFLRKIWPIHLVFRLFIVCRMMMFSFTLCHSSSFPTRSVQMIFCDFLQHHFAKCYGISDLLFEVPGFQLHTKLCFVFSTLLVSSLNWSPFCFRNFFCFCRAILNVKARVHLAPFVIMLLSLNISHASPVFWFVIIFNGDGCLDILITLVFSTVSIAQHLPVSRVCGLLFIDTVSNVSAWSCSMVLDVSALSFISIRVLCSLARATHDKPCTAAEEHWLVACLFQALSVPRWLPVPASMWRGISPTHTG